MLHFAPANDDSPARQAELNHLREGAMSLQRQADAMVCTDERWSMASELVIHLRFLGLAGDVQREAEPAQGCDPILPGWLERRYPLWAPEIPASWRAAVAEICSVASSSTMRST